MTDDKNPELDELFLRYRDACPPVEPGVGFMPQLWERIDGRRSFSFVFQRLARILLTASAAACLLLVALNYMPRRNASQAMGYTTYADALAADHSVERTDYTEAIQDTPQVPADYQH